MRAPAKPSRPGVDEITRWLLAELGRRLKIDPREIEVRREIADYGLDSRQAIRITAALEDWLGGKISPTLLWEYPTVAELADNLAAREASRR